jgi:catechol 2,3-dioxygenase-like lactoylglutathione lyase family enzyme
LHVGIPSIRTPALLAATIVVLAACNPTSGGEANDALALEIVTPADGAEVEQNFEIQVESSVPLGEPETGNHHIHFYFDTDVTDADYQLVYADGAAVDRELPPGEHTIIVSLRNADHSDAGVSDEITVTVGDGGTGDGAAPASDGGSGGPFDY